MVGGLSGYPAHSYFRSSRAVSAGSLDERWRGRAAAGGGSGALERGSITAERPRSDHALCGIEFFRTAGRQRRQPSQTLVAGGGNGLYAARMRQREVPGFVEPMLLTSGRELPSGDDWWAELKLCRQS